MQKAENTFEDYPPISNCEGPSHSGEIQKGSLGGGYGRSCYDFHYEYPIEGIGVKKDRIVVVAEDGRRIPLFDFCRDNGIKVHCRLCGADITFRVKLNDCLARMSSSDMAEWMASKHTESKGDT